MEKFKEKPLLIPKHNKGSGEEGILLLYNGPLYYLVRELMKKENPEAYNALLIAVAKSQNPHSEVVMYTDANGTLRSASNTGAGFVSGTDPVGAEVVAGAVLGKPLELAGRAAMYGLGRAGNKWARAKLISREMQNVTTPNRTYPLHVGLGLPKTTTNYFKDAYGREITPTPYPGTDAELLSYMDEAHINVLKDYFSPEKINLLKSTLGWGDLEIKEFQDELIRTIGYKNNIKTQVKGPEDGFVLIGSHRGGIEGSGNTALGVHSITLNRERIPSAQIALEAVIHELGAHGKTASMKATDFGAGGFTDKMREAFPRMAELVLKNEELANDLLVLNRRGLFFNLFKNIGDLERYFINNNLSWKDKWSKFNDRFNYFKYTTSPQEKMARAYTGQLYNKVYDPTTKTLNIELLENFYTPESVEAFKKAVLGIAPIATISGVVPSDKKGSKIVIKKKNKGKFTEYCGGEVTNECILKAKKSKNPTLRKRATFALNARGWAKKHQEGGVTSKNNPTLEEFIEMKLRAKQLLALDKSRNRLEVLVPRIPNPKTEEEFNNDEQTKIDRNMYNILAGRMAMTSDRKEEEEIGNTLLRLKLHLQYEPVIDGANCLMNASDCYGFQATGNLTFLQRYKDFGFSKVNTNEAQPGDLVLYINRKGVPDHAMIYNGLDQNNMPTFNYAKGHKTGNLDDDYVKGGHYYGVNMNNNYTVYRYTGTPNEIKLWTDEYNKTYKFKQGGEVTHTKIDYNY